MAPMRAVYPGNRYTTHKKWLVCPLLAITGMLCSEVPHLALTCWARVELGVTSVCRRNYSSGAYCGLHDCSRRQFRWMFNPVISSTLIFLRRVWWGNSFVRPWPVSRHYCDIEALYLGWAGPDDGDGRFPPFPILPFLFLVSCDQHAQPITTSLILLARQYRGAACVVAYNSLKSEDASCFLVFLIDFTLLVTHAIVW
jgi:hypothetical protein